MLLVLSVLSISVMVERVWFFKRRLVDIPALANGRPIWLCWKLGEDDIAHYAEVLIPFFVSRQIYTGAGKVFQTQDGVHYCISQRAQHIYQKISGTTTNDRSIINTRDEPHGEGDASPRAVERE